jgi:hypothetical protein
MQDATFIADDRAPLALIEFLVAHANAVGSRNSRTPAPAHSPWAIHPRLIGGQDFTEAEVQLAGYVALEFIVLADGLVVGGLTFVLDPHLHHPLREFPEERDHDHPHEHREEHKKERRHDDPRRIKLEIDLD